MSITTAEVPVCTVADSGGFAYDPTIRALFAEDILNPGQVTREEMDYAVDTTDQYCLVGISGWEVVSDITVDPVWGLFDEQRPGRLRMRSPTNTLTYAADRYGNDIREIMHRNVRGWVLLLPAGDLPGALMNVYPVRCASVTPLQRLQNGGAQIEVLFAITGRPTVDVRIPSGGNVTWEGQAVSWNGQEVTWL